MKGTASTVPIVKQSVVVLVVLFAFSLLHLPSALDEEGSIMNAMGAAPEALIRTGLSCKLGSDLSEYRLGL